MAKKSKTIKRVYERGRETILSSSQAEAPKAASVPSRKPQARGLPQDKAVINPQPLKRKALNDEHDLPYSYNNTSLVLMVKDPFWIYAYWDISSASWEDLIKKIPSSEKNDLKVVLRMYDVTLKDFNGYNANHYFDIEVGSQAKSWYINLWSDSVSYLGEIGLRSQSSFYPLARSNAVHTPRLSHSSRTDQIWMEVRDEEAEDHLSVSYPALSKNLTSGERSKARQAFADTRSQFTKERKLSSITEEDVRRYYERLNPFLKDIIGSAITRKYAKQKNLPQDARYFFKGEPMSEKECRDALALFPGRFFRKIFLGASEMMELTAEGILKNFGGASESSASEAKFSFKKRNFFFELDTELIIYGRTAPDAAVALGDKEIKLRPDGTFSLRFHLPDGNIPLEFKAVSSDKEEERNINTYINRNTVYKNR